MGSLTANAPIQPQQVLSSTELLSSHPESDLRSVPASPIVSCIQVVFIPMYVHIENVGEPKPYDADRSESSLQ